MIYTPNICAWNYLADSNKMMYLHDERILAAVASVGSSGGMRSGSCYRKTVQRHDFR